MMFLLDGNPRCGSTTLTHLLNLHPEIQCAMEPLHPSRYHGVFNAAALKLGMPEAVRQIKARWNGLKHVWEPSTGWPFASRPSLNDELVRTVDKVIILRRRNLLRQIVSGHISRHLRFFVGTRDEFLERLDQGRIPALVPEEARRLLEAALHSQCTRDKLLLSSACQHMTLYYEDVFEAGLSTAGYADFCDSLFVFLGVRGMRGEEWLAGIERYARPETYKWATPEIYQRIPGLRSVDKEIGSASTGFIF